MECSNSIKDESSNSHAETELTPDPWMNGDEADYISRYIQQGQGAAHQQSPYDSEPSSSSQESSLDSLPRAPSPPNVSGDAADRKIPPVGMLVMSSSSSSSRDGSENDTFYEDRSLERRLHRVLELRPPELKTPKRIIQKKPTPKKRNYSSAKKKISRHEKDRTTPSQDQKQLVGSSSPRLEQEVARLSQAVTELTLEKERLQQERPSSFTEKHSEQDHAEYTRLCNTLKMTQTELLREKEAGKIKIRDLTKRMTELQDENETMVADVEDLHEKYRSSQQQIDTLTIDKEHNTALLSRVMNENVSLQQEIQSLQDEAAAREKTEASDPYQDIVDKYHVSQQQLEDFRKSDDEAHGQMNQLRKEKQGLKDTIESLMSDLEMANETVDILRAKLKSIEGMQAENKGTQTEPFVSIAMVRAASCQTGQLPESTHVGTQMEANSSSEEKKDDTNHLNDAVVRPDSKSNSDRLSRIRDSTERTKLVKQHQKEISRLLVDHDAEMARMAVLCESEKQQAQEALSLEVENRSKELKKRYEGDIMDLQEAHRAEIEKLKEGTEVSAMSAAESAEATMAQAASLRELGEAQHRHQLEKTVKELSAKHQMEIKSTRERHENDVQSLRNVWEEEKEKLLSFVQKECNIAFDRAKRQSSPRCVSNALEFFPANMAPGMTMNPTPSISELGKSLRETEALVQSLINKPGRP